MTLALVHAREVACFPWFLGWFAAEPVRPAYCRPCGREVALPVARERERPVCIYCALDGGLLACEEIEPGEGLP